jgi:hypothetical protein
MLCVVNVVIVMVIGVDIGMHNKCKMTKKKGIHPKHDDI